MFESIITGIALAVAMFVFIAYAYNIYINSNLLFNKPREMNDTILGKVGKVKRTLSPGGLVSVNGELWSAESANGNTIETGSNVIVQSFEGKTLLVTVHEG